MGSYVFLSGFPSTRSGASVVRPRACFESPACPATPGTHSPSLRPGVPPRRVVGLVQVRPVRGRPSALRSHAPDAAGPALRADDGTFETRPNVPLGGRRKRSSAFGSLPTSLPVPREPGAPGHTPGDSLTALRPTGRHRWGAGRARDVAVLPLGRVLRGGGGASSSKPAARSRKRTGPAAVRQPPGQGRPQARGAAACGRRTGSRHTSGWAVARLRAVSRHAATKSATVPESSSPRHMTLMRL